jgi:hypothetical protein
MVPCIVRIFQYIILHEIRKRKANWVGHILRRNCLLQWVIEGKIKWGIEVTGRRGWSRKKLINDLKERTGYSHLKEEALDRNIWRARFGRGFGPVVRQTAKWMNPTRCNVTQFIISGNCFTCFGWYFHPLSGAHATVSTASDICQTVTATCCYSGR